MTIYQIFNGRDFFAEIVKLFLQKHQLGDLENSKNIIICPNNQTRDEIKTRLIFEAKQTIILPQLFTLYDIPDEFLIPIIAVHYPTELDLFYKKPASELETTRFLYNFLDQNLKSEAEKASITEIMKEFSYAANKIHKNLIENFQDTITNIVDLPFANKKMIELFCLFQKKWQAYQEKENIIDIMSFNIKKIYLLGLIAKNNIYQHKIYLIANFTDDQISFEIIRRFAGSKNCDIIISQLYHQPELQTHYSYLPAKYAELIKELNEEAIDVAVTDKARHDLVEQLFSSTPLTLLYPADSLANEIEHFTIIEPENDFDETNIAIKILANELMNQADSEKSISIVTGNTIQGIAIVESLARYGIFPQNSFKKNITLSRKFSFLKMLLSIFICQNFQQNLLYEFFTSSYVYFTSDKEFNHLIKKFFPLHKIKNLASLIFFTSSIPSLACAANKLKQIQEIISDLDITNFSGVVKILVQIAEILNEDARENIWAEDDGKAISKKLFEIIDSNLTFAPGGALDLSSFFELLTADSLFSAPQDKIHHNISVLSPMEARMKTADLFIILGFNEDYWPAKKLDSAILPARISSIIGLENEEVLKGLQNYYLTGHLFSKKLIFSAPKYIGTSPATCSRWLTRIKLLASLLGKNLVSKQFVLEYNNFFTCNPEAMAEPVHKPALSRRPMTLSATDLETYIASPISLYYNKILGLKDHGDIEDELQKKDLGNLVHRIIEKIITNNDTLTSKDIINKEIKSMAKTSLEQKLILAKTHILLDWASGYIMQNKNHSFISEKPFVLDFTFENDLYHINVRPDLIDIAQGGKANIFDFKTGTAPSNRDVLEGKSLQLQLAAKAAIILGYSIDSLNFIATSRSLKQLAHHKITPAKDKDYLDLLNETEAKIQEILEDIKYKEFTIKDQNKLYGGYLHLSRA